MPRLFAIPCLLLAAAPGFASPGELYFSEYVEGSGSNKALEIFNGTGASVNLAPYQVRFYFNGSASPGLTIGLSGAVADGDVFVLAQSSANAAILGLADQTASGNWFNGDDAVALVKSGVLLDVIGQIGLDPGAQWGTGSASTADNTLRRLASVTGGDPFGGDAFDPALEWIGFPIDTFDGLGTYPDAGTTPTRLAIPAIQGAGHVSPVNGQLVETTGIVTAVDVNGFWLQDPAGDGDPTTSDGIFVFTSTAPAVSVGEGVRVTAQVSEFQPGGASTQNLSSTELHGPVIQVLTTSNRLPAPAILGAAGSLPPTELIDDDGLAVFDPASDGLDFYECFEGMRVRIAGALAVSAKNPFGEIFTVTDGGAFATRLNARSGITLGEMDGNPERIKVQIDHDLVPGFDPDVTTGDSLGDVVGVVGYDFGNYEVKATQPFSVRPAGLQPETARFAGADDELTVGDFNLHNLDAKVESLALVGSFADIDDDIGDGQFARLAAEIAQNLRAPDILAVQEIQDDDGAEQTTVTDASLTYATLVDAIVAAGGPSYAFRDIPPVDDSSGGQPGGNIRVGFLFNPARVSLDEASLHQVLDTDLGNGDAFEDSRTPLAATFEFQGRRVTLIDNHFSSKSGGTPLFGLVQPPINGAVGKRIAQAQVVHDAVAELLARDPDANVIVLGDLNEFSFNEPLKVLAGEPTPILTDLADELDDVERYSYVFDGNAQALDHILASGAVARIADFDVAHVNTEFEDQASDHDPLIASLAFPEVCQPDLGIAGPGAATLAVCGDPLAPTGNAELVVSGLPPGSVGFLFFGLVNAPHATHGGTLVPVPVAGSATLLDGDLDGVIGVPLSGALVDVPASIFVQFVYVDVGLAPFGYGFSNAVEVRFLGESS